AAQISRAVAEVEKSTAGELVVVVIKRSDDYAYPRALLALVLAIACGWLTYWSLPTLQSSIVFGAQALFWSVFWWLSGLGPMLRLLVPKEQQLSAVDAKAKQM